MASVDANMEQVGLSYSEVTLSGIICLEITSAPACKDNAKARQRKKDKDSLGFAHLEVPLIDSKLGDNGIKEINDLIIYANKVKLWDEEFVKYYESMGYGIESKDLNQGNDVLRNVQKHGVPFVSLSFYGKTSKFMVQPGNRNTGNMMKWLADFSIIKQIVTESVNISSDDTPKSLQDSSPNVMANNSEINTGADSAVCPETASEASVPEAGTVGVSEGRVKLKATRRSKRLNCGSPASDKPTLPMKTGGAKPKTVINCSRTSASGKKRGKKTKAKETTDLNNGPSPVKRKRDDPPEGYINLVIARPPLPLGAKFHENKFVVNDVLCYLQNKMDSTPFDVLVKLTSDFYPAEVISDAKNLLFHIVNETDIRYRQCIGPNKKRDDTRDMLKLLLAAELCHTPIFLALDVTQVPPINSDCQDISVVMQKIEAMQTSIGLISDAQRDLTEVVSKQVKTTDSSCRGINVREHSDKETNQSQVNPPLRLRDGGYPAVTEEVIAPSPESTERSSDKPSYSEAVTEMYQCDTDDPTEGDPLSVVSESPEPLQPAPPKPRRPRVVTNSTLQQGGGYKPPHPQDRRHQGAPQPSRRHQNTWQGSVDNSKNPSSSQHNIMVGRGTAPGLQVARRGGPREQSGTYNRSCTGIFVTSLHPKTSAQQLDTFVRRETGLKVTSEKLQTRFESYSSFYIPCEQRLRNDLMDPYLWPAYCKVKPYYS